MVLQAQKGIENNRIVQIVLSIIIIAIVCGFFIYVKVTAPINGVVDGIYRNKICGDIVINGDLISQGNKTLPLKIRNMKFGLTGYVKGRFSSEGMRESDEETSIIFFSEGGKRALSLPIDGREYTFRRVENSRAI